MMRRVLTIGVWSTLAVVFITPLATLFGLLFFENGQWTWAGLGSLFEDRERLGILLGNTLTVLGLTVGVALMFGAPLGFLLFRVAIPGRRLLQGVCLVAACVPLYVTATMWMSLLGMSALLQQVWAAGWIQGVAYVPVAALICGTGFLLVDPELEDAVRLDAHSHTAAVRTQFPVLVWSMAIAGLAVGVLSLWDITVTDILLVRTFGEEVFTQFQLGAGPARALALALPVMLIVGVASAGVWGLCRRGWGQPLRARLRSPRLLPLSGSRRVLLGVCAVVVTSIAAVPLCALVRDVESLPALAGAWRVASRELLYTLAITPPAAGVTVLIALPVCWVLVRTRGWRWPVGAVLLCWLAIPAPTVGIALTYCLNQPLLDPLLYDTWAAVMLVFVLRSLPFAVLVLIPAMLQVPRDLQDDCVLEGVPVWRILASVFIPMHWRSLLAAWGLAFVFSLSELGASFLVVPPGRTTLSVRFFTLIHYGVYPDAAGICLLLVLIVALVGVALALAIRPPSHH